MKTLILSNTPFHQSDSNGRILGLLLQCINNENKLQLCINGTSVSSSMITNCYLISDKTVLKNLFCFKIKATKLPVDMNIDSRIRKTKRIKRTAKSLLLRDLIWKACLARTEFLDLAVQFQPDVVLWQYGDSGFMADLARIITDKCGAKLVIYTTEDYCFKTWDYLEKKNKTFFYTLFSHEMRLADKQAFDKASLCIANTPQLAKKFQDAFGCKVETIMNSSVIDKEEREESQEHIENRIVYAGNLGINRHLSIIKIAEALRSVAPNIIFEIYGQPNKIVANELKDVQNIKLMGFKSYHEIQNIIKQSLLVIHTESFEEFYRYDLESAFSSKITDALKSGTPLFMYAPENLAETDYLIQNKCAFVCTEKQYLEDTLRKALFGKTKRHIVISNGIEIVYKNHDAQKNSRYMLELLQSV